MAVETNFCLSSDLMSIRSTPKPIGRTDQLLETGAVRSNPVLTPTGQVHQRRPPYLSGQVCTPDFRATARGNRPDIERQ
jgi:hypothetical protein